MNNRGQALIEFTIILPILLFILLYIIDFSRIGVKKMELESDMNLIVNLFQNQKNEQLNEYVNSRNIEINYETSNNLTTITIFKTVKYNMPFLNNIIGTKIDAKRTIYNEQ